MCFKPRTYPVSGRAGQGSPADNRRRGSEVETYTVRRIKLVAALALLAHAAAFLAVFWRRAPR
jgi:hypothetical protein